MKVNASQMWGPESLATRHAPRRLGNPHESMLPELRRQRTDTEIYTEYSTVRLIELRFVSHCDTPSNERFFSLVAVNRNVKCRLPVHFSAVLENPVTLVPKDPIMFWDCCQ
jgi:hypothetical protein